MVKKYVLSLDERAAETLDRLQAATDASCYAEVIRNAIGLYEWAREQHAAGRGIGVIDREGENIREVVLPFWFGK